MKKRVYLVFLMILLLASLSFAAVPDADKDGVPDSQDYCPGSLSTVVDQYGCTCAQKTNINYCEQGARTSAPICCHSDNNPCTDDCSANDIGKAACNLVKKEGSKCILGSDSDENPIYGNCQAGNCYPNGPRCGDGVINQKTEVCDGTNLDGKTCQLLGYASGSLGCLENCIFDTSKCVKETKCEDSDGGKDYYAKGLVKSCVGDSCTQASDVCSQDSAGKELIEEYCGDDGLIYSAGYRCPNGCKDGACIKKCPMRECPPPPAGCNYVGGTDENGCPTCGTLVCGECGNNICEEGEGDNCPTCKAGDEICLKKPCRQGTCPQDCVSKPVCGNNICEEGEPDICYSTGKTSKPPLQSQKKSDIFKKGLTTCQIGTCPQDCGNYCYKTIKDYQLNPEDVDPSYIDGGFSFIKPPKDIPSNFVPPEEYGQQFLNVNQDYIGKKNPIFINFARFKDKKNADDYFNYQSQKGKDFLPDNAKLVDYVFCKLVDKNTICGLKFKNLYAEAITLTSNDAFNDIISPLAIIYYRMKQKCPTLIKEQYTCVFDGSTKEESCSSTDHDASCTGIGSCTETISGNEGDYVTWKSTCGGYQYTTLDGYDETIYFNCQPQQSGFKFAIWGCSNGYAQSQGGEDSCKDLETWFSYAKDSCTNNVEFFNVYGKCGGGGGGGGGVVCPKVPVEKCGTTPGCEVAEKRDWKKLFIGTTKECVQGKQVSEIVLPLPVASCGNGIIDANELCDGKNLNEKTCAILGYAGGSLECSSNCIFDTYNCIKVPSPQPPFDLTVSTTNFLNPITIKNELIVDLYWKSTDSEFFSIYRNQDDGKFSWYDSTKDKNYKFQPGKIDVKYGYYITAGKYYNDGKKEESKPSNTVYVLPLPVASTPNLLFIGNSPGGISDIKKGYAASAKITNAPHDSDIYVTITGFDGTKYFTDFYWGRTNSNGYFELPLTADNTAGWPTGTFYSHVKIGSLSSNQNYLFRVS